MMETRGIEPLTPALQTYGCTPGTRIMQVQATRQLSELSLMDANAELDAIVGAIVSHVDDRCDEHESPARSGRFRYGDALTNRHYGQSGLGPGTELRGFLRKNAPRCRVETHCDHEAEAGWGSFEWSTARWVTGGR